MALQHIVHIDPPGILAARFVQCCFDFIGSDLLSSFISELIQGMLVVVRQDYSNRQDLSVTLRQLEYLHIKVLGFVMTGGTASGGRYSRYGRYGRYQYGYGEEQTATPAEKQVKKRGRK